MIEAQRKLRILQSAGGALPVSPRLDYAGTERVALWLDRDFSDLNHESYVAAPGDSELLRGTLLPTYEKSLWSQKGSKRNSMDVMKMEEAERDHYIKVLDYLRGINPDILQDHPGSGIVTSKAYENQKNNINTPIVTTLHGPVDGLPEGFIDTWKKLQEGGYPVYFNAISDWQKKAYEEAGINVNRFIHHGINTSEIDYTLSNQDYLFWIGRLSKIKGTDLAIKVAKQTKRPLIIAGEVHDINEEFCNREVMPYVNHNFGELEERVRERKVGELFEKLNSGENIGDNGEIYFVGPLNDDEKLNFYKYAYATLMPNRWKEPFGLVMIESLASGTPIVGTQLGAIPEIVENEKTGYVVPVNDKGEEMNVEETVNNLSRGVEDIGKIKNVRRNSRKSAEEKFDNLKMAQKYIDFYKQITQ